MNQRGSSTIEMAIITPVVLALMMLLTVAGRLAMARQAIGAVAFDGARAASLTKDSSTAQAAAANAATHALASNSLNCQSRNVSVDTSRHSPPLGVVGTVTVEVTCVVALSDVALPGLPSTIELHGSASSPVDPYRER